MSPQAEQRMQRRPLVLRHGRGARGHRGLEPAAQQLRLACLLPRLRAQPPSAEKSAPPIPSVRSSSFPTISRTMRVSPAKWGAVSTTSGPSGRAPRSALVRARAGALHGAHVHPQPCHGTLQEGALRVPSSSAADCFSALSWRHSGEAPGGSVTRGTVSPRLDDDVSGYVCGSAERIHCVRGLRYPNLRAGGESH